MPATTLAAAPAPPTVLLTGVTGFLGKEMLAQLLTGTDAEVVCLVRAGAAASATSRLRSVVDELFGRGAWSGVRHRASAVDADVTLPGLGLDRGEREDLGCRVTHIVHGAASVRFDQSLAAARRINVRGTVAMLDLADMAHRSGRLQRFEYISTAFVGGSHPQWFAEDDLDVGQRFRNTYEQSKFEAELEIRAAMRDTPITVVRPSIIVGHSQSGATSSFNVIYWPLRAYADGMFQLAPTGRDLPVDLVPVDFVARGALEAVLHGEPGQTYALAAGARATSAGVIGDNAARVFSTRSPHFVRIPLQRVLTPLVYPLLGAGPWRHVGSALRQYLPYFERGSRFDTTHADALLRPRGLEPPPVAQFLEPILQFAKATDFGRDTRVIAARQRELKGQRRAALRPARPAPRSPRLRGTSLARRP